MSLFFYLIFSVISVLCEVNNPKEECYTFSRDITSLSTCMEIRLLKDDSWKKEVKVAQTISNRAAVRFSGKIKTRKRVLEGARDLFKLILKSKNAIINPQKLTIELRTALQKALLYCAESRNNNSTVFNSEDKLLKFSDVAVSRSQKLYLLNPDKKTLSECIENHVLNSDRQYEKNGFKKIIRQCQNEKNRSHIYFVSISRLAV